MDDQNQQQPVADPGMPQAPVQPDPAAPVMPEPQAPAEPVGQPMPEPTPAPMPEPQAPVVEPVAEQPAPQMPAEDTTQVVQ